MKNRLLFLTILLMGVVFVLSGCALLDQAKEDEATLILVETTSAETVAISRSNNQQLALAQELATLKQEVLFLSTQLETQQGAETVYAENTQIALDPIIVKTEPIDVQPVPYTLSLQDTLTALYDKVNPSVVFIIISNQQTGLGSSGSGFVYDTAGHIVTNNHVVKDATDIEVVFSDGTSSSAELVGSDIDSDLAVIRVEQLPAAVEPIPLSSMATIDVGQFAVAIGNPFGEQGSMSLGIISGLGRSLQSQRVLNNTGGSYQLPQVIQTDAPINPGNSGGPLLNLAGEVIGINSAIRTTTGENSGVGFSIPVDAVSIIIPELIENGVYSYPYLGLSFINEFPKKAILERSGIDSTFGAYVGRAVPNGPAGQAGVVGSQADGLGGDLIIALNGQQIKDFDDLNAFLVFNTKPDDTIEATILRDGEEIIIEITLGARP